MKTYAIQRNDGVTILKMVEGTDIAQEIEKWKSSYGPVTVVSYKEIAEVDIPSDRYFRAAWKLDGSLKVDMDKARTIHMGKIRESRNKRLDELDKRKYGSEYDAERQSLRDIPTSFDLSAAKTPEELKALWPANLDRPT